MSNSDTISRISTVERAPGHQNTTMHATMSVATTTRLERDMTASMVLANVNMATHSTVRGATTGTMVGNVCETGRLGKISRFQKYCN